MESDELAVHASVDQVGHRIAASTVWNCAVSGWVNTARSDERLGLEGLVLRLRDGSGIEQLLGTCDLFGRALGTAGNLLDVPLLLGLLLLNRRPLPLAHAPAPRNEVDPVSYTHLTLPTNREV